MGALTSWIVNCLFLRLTLVLRVPERWAMQRSMQHVLDHIAETATDGADRQRDHQASMSSAHRRNLLKLGENVSLPRRC